MTATTFFEILRILLNLILHILCVCQISSGFDMFYEGNRKTDRQTDNMKGT